MDMAYIIKGLRQQSKISSHSYVQICEEIPLKAVRRDRVERKNETAVVYQTRRISKE